MFPVTARYIDGQYIKGGQPVRIADPKLIQELKKNAKKSTCCIEGGKICRN